MLRPYEAGDVSLWQKWDIDSEVQTFMPEPKNEPMNTEAGIEYLKECQNESDGYYWSMVWKEGNVLVGTISICEVNTHHGIGELGIVIGEKEYWGKGVATEAIKILLEFLPELKLRRIVAELEEGNNGLVKALEKNGFKKECVCEASRIKNSKPINTIRYVRFV